MTSPVRKATMASLLALFSASSLAQARASIDFLPTRSTNAAHAELMSPADRTQLSETIEKSFDLNQYRNVGVQVIMNDEGHADHLLVYLHALNTHRVDMASIQLGAQNEVLQVQAGYSLQEHDLQQQPGLVSACPDPSTQFIAFAPNNDALELQITHDVAAGARAKGLKTVELYTQQATRAAYLAYMSCPNLVGNFYDGDANPKVIVANDGLITVGDLAQFRFNFHVTNIWLACEAFNDPILTTVMTTAQSQKYAAGINDLIIGPSDRTAKCTMLAALNGQPMTQSFKACYKSFDNAADHWGFQGAGSDQFGH